MFILKFMQRQIGISVLQHIVDSSQPIAIFNSLDKSVEFFGDLDIPNFYNKTKIDNLLTNFSWLNYYIKNQVDSFIYNINLADYYAKASTDTTSYTNYTSLTLLTNSFLFKN